MSKAKRAKKSRRSKKLLFILVLLAIISGIIINFKTEIETSIASIKGSEIKSYEANDYVKDIFTENDGTRYLPIVYNDPDEQVSKTDIERKFAQAGIPITNISSNTIATGTKIETPNAKYTVLIYGDINGDGKVNVRDVQKIVQHLLYGNSYELKDIYKTVANVENVKANTIDVRDAQRIVQFIIGKNKLIDALPASDISRDNEAPTITLKGEDPMTIIVNRKYEEPGADVKDNLDPHVRLEIDSSNVDTSKPGTYKVKYTARDASGKTTVVERTVIVEDESIPVITFNDPREYIAVNVYDEKFYNDLDLDAVAIDKKDGEIEVNVTGDVDLDTPGTYTITYSAINSQDKIATKERIIEVINPVNAIYLTGNLTNKNYNEGDKIDLSGIGAIISRRIEDATGPQIIDDITKLGKEFKIVLTPFENAVYNEDNDLANANQPIKIKVIYTNPADNTEVKDERDVNITIYGNIRELVDIGAGFNPKNIGDIYELLPIAKLTTKTYQQKLTDSNLTYTISSTNGNINTAYVSKNITDDGLAEILFWAQEPGKYKVTLQAGIASKEVEVEVSESNVVNIINPLTVENGALYTGILKSDGEAKDIGLEFKHNYGSEQTAKVTLPVNVTKDRLEAEFDNDQGMETKFLTTVDNEFVEIAADDNTSFVTGIRVKAKDVTITPEGTGNKTYSTRKMIIHVDKYDANNVYSTANNIIKVYQASIYTVSFERQDITLYLQAVGNENLVYKDANGTDIYTLIRANKVDQYDEDPDTKKVNADDLSTTRYDIQEGKIVFIDSANQSDSEYHDIPFIEVAGFVDSTGSGQRYSKRGTGDVDYIGISLKVVQDKINKQDIGDEDERIENTGSYIDVYHTAGDTAVNRLNIQKIEKKDITELRTQMLKTNDYCYEKNTIVAKIKSGQKQKDLDASMLTYLVVDENDSPVINGAKVTGENDGKGNVNIKFVAPDAGKYKIIAMLRSNSSVRVSTDVITITENPIVTRIAFRYVEKDVQNGTEKTVVTKQFGQVRVDKSVTHEIVYYHDYDEKDTNGVTISREIESTHVPISGKITFANIPTYLTVTKVNGNAETDPAGEADRVNGLNIRINNSSKMSNSVSFTMIIDRSSYGLEPLRTTVNLTTADKAEIVKVKVESLNPNGRGNLYLDKSWKNNGAGDTVTTINDFDYTVFKIAYIDQDGDEVSVPSNKILYERETRSGKNLVMFIDEFYDSLGEISSIEVIPLVYSDTKNDYVSATGSTSVRYIGIAALPTSEIANLSQISVTVTDTAKFFKNYKDFTTNIPVNVLGSAMARMSTEKVKEPVVPVDDDENSNTKPNNDKPQANINSNQNNDNVINQKPQNVENENNNVTNEVETNTENQNTNVVDNTVLEDQNTSANTTGDIAGNKDNGNTEKLEDNKKDVDSNAKKEDTQNDV